MTPYEIQKQVLVDLFEQAKAYVNVIMVTGYAGLFGLWSIQSDRLTAVTSLAVGLLLAISISAFVGWEIYAIVQRYISIALLRKSVDNPSRGEEVMRKQIAISQTLMRRLERYWWPIVFIAGGTAAAAMGMLISAFIHGLILTYKSSLTMEGSAMELNFASLLVGGFLAGVVGVIALRLNDRANAKRSRNALAAALESDLRACADLYQQLIDFWNQNRQVLFRFMDQIGFVRSNYNTDRTHFALLNDDDTRTRINEYFRTSFVVLTEIQQAQQKIYTFEDEDQIASQQRRIDELFEELVDIRVTAIEIADQLHMRFR